MNKYNLLLIAVLLSLFTGCNQSNQDRYYYPLPGNHITHHDRHQPEEVGLNPELIVQINEFIQSNPYVRNKKFFEPRWAIWRNGYLIHVEGDFYKKDDVASLRKTWHAMTVGAAIQQGKIRDVQQKISEVLPELKGFDAEATWKNVITQSAGFDYPYDTFPDYEPGEMWTYSDLTIVHLCNALARKYGKKNYYDGYDEVARKAYFDAIGMKGWETRIIIDRSFGDHDGIRFVLNLEHMGRLGLLVLSRGRWEGKQLIPQSFVEDLETKQTYGMTVNYNGPNDGRIGRNKEEFPESPYGYLTWTNTDSDLFKGADKSWATGSGYGGAMIMWNKNNGIVFTGFGIKPVSDNTNLPLIIEKNITRDNPLLDHKPMTKIGRWSYFEKSLEKEQIVDTPYGQTGLLASFKLPDGEIIRTRGFYDGNQIWKVRFMPSLEGVYNYELKFKDENTAVKGQFEVQSSNIPGLINKYKKNPIWFGYKDGEAELLRSFHIGDKFTADTCNSITGESWSKEQRGELLDWLQERGYNMLSIASLYLNRDAEGRGKGWKTPDLWDTVNQVPDYREYQRMETILEDLSVRKILVYPFAGFFGRNSNYPDDEEKRKLFLQYTINRMGSYWNLMYMVGGPEPLLVGQPYMTSEQVSYWGTFIDSLDVYDHILSCHNYTGNDLFKDEPWTDYGILQGPKTLNRKVLNKGLLQNHHAEKPLYAQETLWTGNKYHPDYSLDDIRKNAYVITMSAAMINYAHMNGNSSSGFSGSLSFEQMRPEIHEVIHKVWDFFESIPFYELKPNQNLVNNGYCLAKPGEYYLVYLPEGGKSEVELSNSTFEANWIPGINTYEKHYIGEFSGPSIFEAPDNSDWLLLLTEIK
ncbi:DUF5060 domain-containing protein [Bacteroidota bacterium]